MKKIFKVLIGIGVLLIALIVAGVAVLSSMDFNDYKALIAEKANEATGRDLVISGDLELNISLSPSVSVNGVTFSNASWGSNPEMLSLDSFAAEVALIPLLSGDVQVKRIVLKGVNVLLETDDGGHGNWEFKSATDGDGDDSSGGSDSDGSLPVVHSVLVQDVKVQYKDGVTGQAHNLTLAKLDLSAASADDPMSLVMEAIYNNENLAIAGTLGSIEALSDNDMFPVKLDVSALGAEIGLDGTVTEPRAGKGLNIGFNVSGDDLSAIANRGMTMAGVDGGAPLPAKSITVSGALRDLDGGYAIDGLALKIGGSDISGNLALNLAGARPGLKADFSSTHFDAADVQDAGSSEPTVAADTGPDDGRVFPNDPLPLDGLKAADADITFAGKEVIAGGVTLGNVDTKVNLSNGLLNVSTFGFDFGGGRIGGKVKLDGSGNVATLALSVDGKKIDYGMVLKDMTGEETVTGMADVSVNANGAGKSVRALMAGLDGKLRVVSEKGHIDSGALAFLTGPLAGLLGGADTNDLRCAVLDFDIVKGMATSKATVFETGGLSIIGAGGIDLREEKLDLYFDPRAKSASVASAAEVGIVVGGTLKEPSVGPDVGDVAMGAASLATGIATGGISLLIGAVVDSVASGLDSTDYCALALAGKPLKPDEQAQPEGETPSEQPATQEEEAPVEGLLNNLFGN
jgi:AsmA family protein